MFKRKRQIVSIFCILFFVFWFSIVNAISPINPDHTTHDPAKCHNLQFNLIIPTSDFVDGMQILRGIVPIRIEMSPQFQGYGRDAGYRILISVDEENVFEQNYVGFEEGNILNMTYQLDTTGLNNGTHLINVYLDDYYAHTRIGLVKVIVDN